MSLTLHYHPLSSFCHKVLIALYEKNVQFTPLLVNLGDATEREAFRRLWPIGKFPVLVDEAKVETIPESTVIIEYLDSRHDSGPDLLPADTELARRTRMLDRFFDLYVHLPMQKIVGDRLRPEGAHDPHGVAEARATLLTALDVLERDLATRAWANGAGFSLADCSAAPALFYANKVMPLMPDHRVVAAYLDRLMQRPSYARVLLEAKPYFYLFPA